MPFFFGKFSEKSLSLHSNQMVLNIDLKEEEVRREARMRGARGSSEGGDGEGKGGLVCSFFISLGLPSAP